MSDLRDYFSKSGSKRAAEQAPEDPQQSKQPKQVGPSWGSLSANVQALYLLPNPLPAGKKAEPLSNLDIALPVGKRLNDQDKLEFHMAGPLKILASILQAKDLDLIRAYEEVYTL